MRREPTCRVLKQRRAADLRSDLPCARAMPRHAPGTFRASLLASKKCHTPGKPAACAIMFHSSIRARSMLLSSRPVAECR
jgi:hypothetical protein